MAVTAGATKTARANADSSTAAAAGRRPQLLPDEDGMVISCPVGRFDSVSCRPARPAPLLYSSARARRSALGFHLRHIFEPIHSAAVIASR